MISVNGLSAIANSAALVEKLDPAIVKGLVEKESGWNPWAWNPEPKFRYFWDVKNGRPFRPVTPIIVASKFPPSDFRALEGDPDQEWWGQQASWGLMQIMGAVARERGWKDPYLPGLCHPATNLELGCRHLAHLLKGALAQALGDVSEATRAALAAYNGGPGGNAAGAPLRNGDYADDVLARAAKYR